MSGVFPPIIFLLLRLKLNFTPDGRTIIYEPVWL